MASIQLELNGLTCGGCVKKVTEALTQHPGVTRAEVTQTSALVEGDLTADDAVALVESLGFEAEAH